MKVLSRIKALSTKSKVLMLGLLAGVAVAVPMITDAEYYPARQPFDYTKECNPDDADIYDRCGSLTGPVFNSFINTPSYGDERAFFDGRRSDEGNVAYNNIPNVTDGTREVVLRMYVHNNANQSTNASGQGIARNTQVRVDLPEAEGQVLRSRAYISADNAALVEDTVDMSANRAFRVEFIPGSAKLYTSALNGVTLSDNIVTTGAPIGHSALNGELPGCFEFEATVELRVRIVPQQSTNLQLVKEVKKSGDEEWVNEVRVKPGENVRWLLSTKNIGLDQIDNVIVQDVLPPHVQLIPGTVRVIDNDEDSPQPDQPLFTNGFNLGPYPSGGARYVTFETRTLGDFEECEVRLRNVAYAKSDQTPETRDDADVIVTKDDCEVTTPQYRCDNLTAQKLSGRTVRFTANATAVGGAEIQRYIFNFGDGSEARTITSNTTEYTYPRDGQFAARVQVQVRVGNQTFIAEGDQCATVVNYASTPGVPTGSAPTKLPEAGASDVVLTFVAVTTASTLGYYYVVARRAARV